MRYVILGGSGQQSKAIVHYLSSTTKNDIVIIDKEEPTFTNPRISFNKMDILGFTPDINNSIVINCLPAEFNYHITKMAISKNSHLIDLGGVTEVVNIQFKLHKAAVTNGVTIVPDCGLAPGIISSIAKALIKSYNDLFNIKIYCGGLPKYPVAPLYYSEVFYLGGVIKEYSGVASEIVGNNIVNYPALSGVERIFVPSLGILEAARTSGGMSNSLEFLNIPNISYRTLRYPGHWDYMKNYIMNQKEPARILNKLINKVGEENPDIVVLIFELEFNNGDKEVIDFFWEYDYENKLSAMSQATGFVVGATARLITDLPSGIISMCDIDSDVLIDYVRDIGPNQFSKDCFRF